MHEIIIIAGETHLTIMKEKWSQFGARFEAILKDNKGQYLIGSRLSYSDILVIHAMTWFIEEVKFPSKLSK